jgi:hypothetical protein
MRRPFPSIGTLALGLWFVGLAACGGGTAATDGGGGVTGGGGAAGLGGAGSGGAAGRAGAPADAGACTAIANTAPTVSPATSAATAPPAAGGEIMGGTYYLTALTFYTAGAACTPPSLQTSSAMIVEATSPTAGSIREDTNQTASGLAIRDAVSTWTYATSGDGVGITPGCVSALSSFSRNASTPVSYTATATEIRTFGPNASCGTSVSIYTKQ